MMDELRFDMSKNVSVDTLARVVVSLQASGDLIVAVKVVRDSLSCGLPQAKEIVDVARNAPRSSRYESVVGLVAAAIDGYCGL
jgi:ribosomal protein L7/L12